MTFQITIRYGRTTQGYFVETLDAADMAQALRLAADRLPPQVATEADLAEIRIAADPAERPYLEGSG